MTTIIGPDFLALQVRDLKASADFYEKVFGFEAEAQSPPGAVVFKTRPIALALRTPLRPLPASGSLGVGMSLWIACEDADDLHEQIAGRGGVILNPPSDGPFGRFFVAGDPDGYGHYVPHRPYLSPLQPVRSNRMRQQKARSFERAFCI